MENATAADSGQSNISRFTFEKTNEKTSKNLDKYLTMANHYSRQQPK